MTKVLANVAILAANPHVVAAAIGATAQENWDVRGAIVTRRIEPAAFAGSPPVVYCTVDMIEATFNSTGPPDTRYGQTT